MSQAFELAVSVCSTAVRQDGIIHDWAVPLALGSPDTGEFLILNYNPVTRCAELQVASDILNLTSVLTFAPDGELLINGQPIASTGAIGDVLAQCEAARDAAQLAAAAAAGSAATASNALSAVVVESGEFHIFATQATADVQAAADQASGAIGQITILRDSAQSAANSASVAAGQAAAARDDAIQRASADPLTIFSDGTKSARGYAVDAERASIVNRAAAVRNLVTADLPETITPGKLFTRARGLSATAGIITIPPGVWTDQSGEAWMTYRLETVGGTIKFQKVTGTTTLVPASLISGVERLRARVPTTPPGTLSLTTSITPPIAYNGKLVFMILYAADAAAYTLNVTMTSGVVMTTRRAAVSPGVANFGLLGAIYEGEISDWPGGDIDITLLFTPSIFFLVGKPVLVAGAGTATPIMGFSRATAAASSHSLTLSSLPAQSLTLMLAGQRKVNSAFGSFSTNLFLQEKSNLLGAGPAASTEDSNDARNMSYGFGAGVTPSGGNVVYSASFNGNYDPPALLGISYPPATGATQQLVELMLAGGRDTLTEVGSEAEVWFNPDGRHVYVQIPG